MKRKIKLGKKIREKQTRGAFVLAVRDTKNWKVTQNEYGYDIILS